MDFRRALRREPLRRALLLQPPRGLPRLGARPAPAPRGRVRRALPRGRGRGRNPDFPNRPRLGGHQRLRLGARRAAPGRARSRARRAPPRRGGARLRDGDERSVVSPRGGHTVGRSHGRTVERSNGPRLPAPRGLAHGEAGAVRSRHSAFSIQHSAFRPERDGRSRPARAGGLPLPPDPRASLRVRRRGARRLLARRLRRTDGDHVRAAAHARLARARRRVRRGAGLLRAVGRHRRAALHGDLVGNPVPLRDDLPRQRVRAVVRAAARVLRDLQLDRRRVLRPRRVPAPAHAAVRRRRPRPGALPRAHHVPARPPERAHAPHHALPVTSASACRTARRPGASCCSRRRPSATRGGSSSGPRSPSSS